jgi:hypothetical protein
VWLLPMLLLEDADVEASTTSQQPQPTPPPLRLHVVVMLPMMATMTSSVMMEYAGRGELNANTTYLSIR